MEDDDILKLVGDILDIEGSIEILTELSSMPEWDSLGRLSVVAALDDIGLDVDIGKIDAATTVEDLVEMFRIKNNDEN